MGNLFNPGSAQYRRVVVVTSAYTCSFVALHTLMMDFGKQEHIFSPIQRYLHKRLDEYYEITDKDLIIVPTVGVPQPRQPVRRRDKDGENKKA